MAFYDIGMDVYTFAAFVTNACVMKRLPSSPKPVIRTILSWHSLP
jgi:hypothetical protein